jgi:hypothetical protein
MPRRLDVPLSDQMLRIRCSESPTIHDHLHIIQKTVNDSQGLRHSHPGLFLRESVQSLQYRLDLAIPQQLLRELLCSEFRSSRRL